MARRSARQPGHPPLRIDLDAFNADSTNAAPHRDIYIVTARHSVEKLIGPMPSDALFWTYEGRIANGDHGPWRTVREARAEGLAVRTVKPKKVARKKRRDERAS